MKCSHKTWHYYPPGNICYKLFPETSSYTGSGIIKNQALAREACVEHGGCLVTIDTEGKQNFIDNLVHRYYLYPDCRTDVNPRYCIWTSGNTTLQFGPWPSIETWQWDNCPSIEPLSKTGFINWPQGEPAYYSGHNAAGQYDTGIMFNQPALTGKGNWNNLDPRRQLSWMCQKAALTQPPSTEPPSTGTIVLPLYISTPPQYYSTPSQ